MKCKYMLEDTVEYMKDLVSGRTNEAMWKTSKFLWRRIYNLDVLVLIWDLIKHGVHITVHGMKHLYLDGKWAVIEKKQKLANPYPEVSYRTYRKMSRVSTDYKKFIPFSFFILIPGGEALLPAWVMVFPNSIPS